MSIVPLFGRRSDRSGFTWTVVAALAAFALTAIPTLFPSWFVSDTGRAPNQGAWIATGIMVLALLSGFRPARWFLLIALPTAALTYAHIATRGSFTNGFLLLTCCCACAWAALIAPPVRRYFGVPKP